MSFFLTGSMLIKKVSQSGEILMTEKNGCFVRVFDKIRM